MAIHQLLELSALCVGAYTLYYTIYAVYLAYFHPLARFPGPRLWAISRLPWACTIIRGDLWQTLEKLHKKYGTVVRIAPDELSTVSPNAWKDLYVSKPLLLKDPYSQTPPLNGADSLFTAEGTAHRRLRATLASSFSDKALGSQAPVIEKYVAQLVARVCREASASPNGRADLAKLYGYAAFDTITDLSLGESLARGLEGDNEHNWMRSFFLHGKFSAVRIALARFWPLSTLLGMLFLQITRKARHRNWLVTTGALDRRLTRVDAEKSGPSQERPDLITPLIDRIEESGQNGITKAELLTNGLAFVIAGSQLNTNILSTATYLLLRHPEQLDRAAEEVRTRFSNQGDITVQSTQNLAYLDAVINETIRIRHPTPINLPRVIPPGEFLVDGVVIPGNTVIGINLQTIQNHPDLWVKPREFHPERFLESNDPRWDDCFAQDVKEAFAPFSVGPRNCIGRKLFFAQVRVVLANILWKFDLEWEPPAQEEDWLEQKAWFAFEPRPIMVKPVVRPGLVSKDS